jgi:hypothetical protein
MPLLLNTRGPPPPLAEEIEQANDAAQPSAKEVAPTGHIFVGYASLESFLNERLEFQCFADLPLRRHSSYSSPSP